MEGSAKFLVLEVGLHTQSGQIMAMLTTIEGSSTSYNNGKER